MGVSVYVCAYMGYFIHIWEQNVHTYCSFCSILFPVHSDSFISSSNYDLSNYVGNINISVHTKNTVRLRKTRVPSCSPPPTQGNIVFISTSCHIVNFVAVFFPFP